MTVVTANKRKRPVAVTIVGTIGMLFALISLALAIYVLWGSGVWADAQQGPLVEGVAPTTLGIRLTEALYDLVSGLVTLVILWGFLRVRPWAWIGLMVWVGVGLGVQLVRYIYGDPNYLRMVICVVVALALNQAEVQEAFGFHRRDNGDLDQLA